MGKFGALAAFVCLALFSYHCSALKYENGKTYKYTYSTSVLFNDLESRKLTKAQKDAGLQITLDVDVSPVYQDTDSQLFKLKLNTAKVVSASRENREKPLGSLLKHPVYFQLERNSVGKIFIPMSDPAFCSNIKKGIISLFQVQNEPGERTEIDISGECSVQYTRHTDTMITKTKTDCKNMEIAGQYSNTNKALGVSVWGITTQEYTIEDDIIKKVTGTNKVNSYLNMRTDLNGAATVTQDLTFQSMLDNSAAQITAANTEEAVKFLEKETGSTLILSLLPSISESSQCTENCESPLKLIPVLHDDLIKEQMATVTSAKAFIKMLKSFRSSGKDSIAEVMTSKDSYLIVPQLIDIAAATQTSAGLKAVMELLAFDDDYSTEHPERFLLAAAYSTHPGEYLLKELVSILNKNIPSQSLKESLMMATGAIIHTYCQVKDKCTNQIVQDYRSLVLTGLSKCEDEVCTGMCLRALGNAGLPDTVTTIIVHAEHANTSLLCEMAIKALRRMNKEFITEEVIETMLRIFHGNEKSYDTSVRIAALNVILQSNPSVTTLRNVLLSITDQTNYELSTFIKLKIHDVAKQDKNLRTTLQSIYEESKINNYNVLAQRGKSSVVTNLLATTSDMHVSYRLVFENSNSGVMKRSGMDVNLLGHTWTQPFLDFSIFADGLESLMGEESTEEPAPEEESEEESGVEAMAGMSFTLMNVVLKQVEFFRGMSGLMSAVWNAPSELTSALQGNLLLQDHYQRVHLSNGLILNVAVMGVLSMDLSGYVSISLWNRNCDSLIRNSGAFYIEGSMQLESSQFSAGVIFTGEGASAIDFLSVADFYEMPVKLCMQMKRPDFTFRKIVTKFEQINGSKKYTKKITKTSSFSAESYLLNRGNSRECKKINEGQD